MKENKVLIGIGLLFLVSILIYSPIEVSGTLIWSEDFDELNDDLWEHYSCQIIDGVLRGRQGDHVSAVRAYYRSNISVGTWKFDLVEIGGWGEELDIMKIYFISPEKPDYSDSYALSLVQASSTSGDRYSYTLEKWHNAFKTTLDNYLGEPRSTVKGLLHHFTITRESNGLMSVYVNSTRILQATDTDITNSEYFGFYTWDDWAFDNVSVYDTIEIGQSSVPVIVGAIGIVVFVVVLLFVMKIRNKN